MNPGVLSVRNNRVVFVAMLFVLRRRVRRPISNIGRLEDPEFTIKEALIITPYPGASAEEVAKEVTNPIESACQQLGQLDRVESESSRGMSVVIARSSRTATTRTRIPQVWDELRRKIADVQPQLPPSVRGTVDGGRRFRRRVRHLPGHHRRRLLARRSCAATPSSCAASCCWCRTSRRSSCSPSSRKSSSSKSRGSGWRSSASTRSRSTPSCRRGTSPPTAAACASATSTSRSIRKARFGSAEDMLELVIGSDQIGPPALPQGRRDARARRSGPAAPAAPLRRQAGHRPGHLHRAGRQRRDDGRRRPAQARPSSKPYQPIGIEIGEINFQPEAVSAATNEFMFNLGKAVTHRLRRAAVRDGPQDRAHHRHRAVPHDHGDVPRHVHEGRPPDGAHLARAR